MIVSSRAMLICLLATICLLKPVVSKPAYYADEDDETNEVDFEEDSKQGGIPIEEGFINGATDSKYFDEDDESEDDERFKEADEDEDSDEDSFKDEDISKKEIDESNEEDEEVKNSEEEEFVDFNPKEEKQGYFSYMYHKAKDFLKSLGK